MTTILFVHGTGTRRTQFDATFKLIRQNLLSKRPDLTLTPCYWGEPLGAALYADGASVPAYARTRRSEEMKKEDQLVALWEQLYRDPLFELRLLSIKADNTGGSHVRGGPPQPDLLRSFTPTSALQAKLAEAGIAEVFATARQFVQHSDAYQKTLQGAAHIPDWYRIATARALVATSMMLCEDQQKYAPIVTDAHMRDQIIDQISNELVGNRRSLGGWGAKQMFELALTLGVMDQVQRKRGALTDATYPFAGDILLYQAGGEKIRAFISELVQQAEPPLVLLGHSLGGIACVDLLIEEALPQVELLITVGSQAPFFYEINALHSLKWPGPLPAHFPASWLNIYDLRDFLSYIGANIFPGRVQDVLINSKQPFPRAHGAYFTNPQMWETIIPALP